ncbi:MAG TPA: hypothetical protein VHB79_26590 [Polyangiaceae bacterium]|nr:hypothetical protein [Polyangiaceae bacterium]
MRTKLALAFLLLGCAPESVQPQPAEGADAQRRLQGIRAEHEALAKRLASAPADHLEACRSTSGDCLLQVAEQRGKLVSQFALNPCEDSATSESRSSCVTQQLEGAGHPRELAEYYSLESWCMKQLSACTTKRVEQAKTDALNERQLARQRAAERTPEGLAAMSGVELVKARVEYVRATLPPSVDVCAPDASFEACQERVENERSAFHDSLRGESYDDKAATSAYVAVAHSEAACRQPELDCLSATLSKYGVFPESRKLVDRNLALLGERQKLLGQVSSEAGQHCLTSAQKQRQADIVSAYVAYAREPVLYFRMQLDKAFSELHQDEINCLSAGRKTSPAVQAVAKH